MPRLLRLTAFALLVALPLPASTLPELLEKVKNEFRSGSYSVALDTLAALEAQSRKPGVEKDREALLPIIAFYRGASLAALGRKAEAIVELRAFLAHQPRASLDPAVYPRKVIVAFEEARKTAAPRETPEPGGSLARAFAAFPRPQTAEDALLGEDWADGPVRYHLTAEDRRDFSRLADTVSRSEFVATFWKQHDPRPETPDNEFREEFIKRVAFADARFTEGETPGSQTDRGMVFILLGPPTWIGRKPFVTGEDGNTASRLTSYRTADLKIAALPSGSTEARVQRIDAVTGPGTSMNDASQDWREIWHYRRELLPMGAPYLQVDVEFLTKKGYGSNVLQREPVVLDTLDRARNMKRMSAAR